MKGCEIVVRGDVGHFAGFMGQAGTLLVCGDAGPHLGDSLYEAVLYVGGKIDSLGADAEQQDLKAADIESISRLLSTAGIEANPGGFKTRRQRPSLVSLERRRASGILTPHSGNSNVVQPDSARTERLVQHASHRLHSPGGAARDLRYPRNGCQTQRPPFRRPGFSHCIGVPLSTGRLSGDMPSGKRFSALGTPPAPIVLQSPITIAGMSFGALSANVKEALGRAASAAGISTTTGDGGMTEEERQSSKTLVYQCLPSRYGFNPDDLRRADAVELVLGQGAKPGGGGMLLGQKVSDRVAKMRTLPAGIDQRSACRHPDWVGPDDLKIKIEELREITDWQIPVYVKMGATRVRDDVKLAVKAGADVGRYRRHAGRHGGDPTGVHRTRRDPHAGRTTTGRGSARRARRRGRGRFDHLRWHPQWGRRSQGVSARRRRGGHRTGSHDRFGMQPRLVLPGRCRSRRE